MRTWKLYSLLFIWFFYICATLIYVPTSIHEPLPYIEPSFHLCASWKLYICIASIYVLTLSYICTYTYMCVYTRVYSRYMYIKVMHIKQLMHIPKWRIKNYNCVYKSRYSFHLWIYQILLPYMCDFYIYVHMHNIKTCAYMKECKTHPILYKMHHVCIYITSI